MWEWKKRRVSGMSFGFLAYPIRLLSFNDVKDTCPVKGVTLTVLNMLYLKEMCALDM